MPRENMTVFVHDYGSNEQKSCEHILTKQEFCEYILTNTLWHAVVNGVGNIVFRIKVEEAGEFIKVLYADPKLNWVEYSFQFDI